MIANTQACMPFSFRATIAAAVVALGLLGLSAGVEPAWSEPAIVDSASKEFRVGWAVYFPYMYMDPKTQKVSGITVDLFEAMAADLGKKVVFVEDSWATMVAGLQAGKFDITMPIANSPARAAVADFTKPIMKISIGLAVLRKDVEKYKDWRDLNKAGVKITTTMGSSVHTHVAPMLQGGADLLLVKSSSESLAQLLTGRADAWANTYEAFMFVEKEQKDITVVAGPAMAIDELSLAVPKGDSRTRERVDAFMKKEKENGALLAIVKKYGLDESFLAD